MLLLDGESPLVVSPRLHGCISSEGLPACPFAAARLSSAILLEHASVQEHVKGRHAFLVGWALGLLGVAVTAVVLGRWFPGASVPLPAALPPKLHQSDLVDKAVLAAIIGPVVGSLYAGSVGRAGPVHGAARGYLASVLSIWLAAAVLPGGFFLALGLSALIALRPTLVLVYFLSLLAVLIGGFAVSALLGLPGGLWGALGATLRESRVASGSTWPGRP